MFGASSSGGGLFGSSSTPAFGASPSPSPLFGGASSSSPLFGGTPATPSTPAFGASSTSMFGGANTSPSPFGASSTASPSIFGAPSTPSLFGPSPTPSMFGSATQSGGLFGSTSQPAFGQSAPFGQTQPSPIFGQPTTPFGQTPGSLFGQTPFGQTQQAQTPLFGQSTSAFGQTSFTPFGSTPQQQIMFPNNQLTTQMAPVAPLSIPLPDREIQAIVDAYKDDPGNPKYGFKHLFLSITDPSMRVKPVGVSDIMWAEAMNKLEGMDSSDRERLWPELAQGFKDLSRRLKIQDEALASDAQRLQATEANVKLLQRHFETDTLPWIQRLRQREQDSQRRLLRVMRMVEALEGKGLRLPLTRGEAQLGEKLHSLSQQLEGQRAELPRRVDTLLSLSRMQASIGVVSHGALLGLAKIDERSLTDMYQVLRQQTEATSRLANLLKRDGRDLEIMMSEDADMGDGDSQGVPRLGPPDFRSRMVK